MLKRIEVKAAMALPEGAIRELVQSPVRWFACLSDGESILEVIRPESLFVNREQAQKACDRFMRDPKQRSNGNWEGVQEGVLSLVLVHVKSSIVEVQEAIFLAKGK